VGGGFGQTVSSRGSFAVLRCSGFAYAAPAALDDSTGTPRALPLSMPAPLIPEVLEPDEKLPPDLVVLRRFAYLMDEAVPVPGTKKRIGIDAGLSLIPGVGEIIGALLSAWIIVGALRHRVPMPRILRMVVYILLDMILGSIPIAGTVFDWLFEENVINLNSLILHRDRTRPPRSFGSIAGAAVAILAIIVGVAFFIAAGMIALIIWITSKR
jgi:hypothetical protein